MPSFGALAALAVVQARGVDIPFIIVSGTVGEETAVAAMRAGAADFFQKGKLDPLGAAIERELREHASRAAQRDAEEQVRQLQKMEAIGSFAAGLAHDFNNVLSVILSYSDILTTDIRPGDPHHEEASGIRLA